MRERAQGHRAGTSPTLPTMLDKLELYLTSGQHVHQPVAVLLETGCEDQRKQEGGTW